MAKSVGAEIKNQKRSFEEALKEQYQQGQLLVCAPLLLNSTD